MKLKSLLTAGVAGAAMALAVGLAPAAQAAEEVEVLHWWTSGGEAAALNVLKQDLEGQGVTWQDMPIAGGGGSEAMTVLRARVTAGNPPTAVQMLGFDIQDWGRRGRARRSQCRRRERGLGRCGAGGAPALRQV